MGNLFWQALAHKVIEHFDDVTLQDHALNKYYYISNTRVFMAVEMAG